MDGYAVRSADTRGAPIELRVVGTLLAGHATSTVVGPGEAMRIMTGAPMPTGADAVVRVEQTRTLGDTVTIQVDVRSGTSVRDPGEDVRRGDIERRSRRHTSARCRASGSRVSRPIAHPGSAYSPPATNWSPPTPRNGARSATPMVLHCAVSYVNSDTSP